MDTDTSETTEKPDFLSHSFDELKDVCKILNSTIENLVEQIENAKSKNEESHENAIEFNENQKKGDMHRVYDKAYSRLSVTCNLSIDAISEVKSKLKDEYEKWKKSLLNENSIKNEIDGSDGLDDDNKAELKLRLVPIEKLMDPKLVNSKSSAIAKKISEKEKSRNKVKEIPKRSVVVEKVRPVRTCTKSIPTICLDDSSGSESSSSDEILLRRKTNTKVRSSIDTFTKTKSKQISNGVEELSGNDLRKFIKPFNIDIKPILLTNIESFIKTFDLELIHNHLMDVILEKTISTETLEKGLTFDADKSKREEPETNEVNMKKNIKANDKAKKKLLSNLDNSTDDENCDNNDSFGNVSSASDKSSRDSRVKENIVKVN